MSRRTLSGIIIRSKSDKTVAVRVVRVFQHSLYKKLIRRAKTYLVHVPLSRGTIGSRVVFRECAPVSKRKRWEIIEA